MWLLTQTGWFLLFCVPAAALVPLVFRRYPTPLSWAALSLTGGYLLEMLAGFIMLHAPESRAVLLAAIAVAAAGAWYGLWRKRHGLGSLGRSEIVQFAVLIVALAVSMAPRAWFQVEFGEWPRGWDPKFHLTLVRAMQIHGGVPAVLAPFEQVHINYPYGAHLAVVGQSAVSGQMAHVAFSAHNSVIGGMITSCVMGALAERWLGSVTAGFGALLVYANMIHYGSCDYQTWGGLPNQMGMALAMLALMFRVYPRSRFESLLGIFLLGAAFFVHHHVMITIMLALGAHRVLECLCDRSARPLAVLLGEVAGALLVACPITFPFLQRIGELRSSQMLRYPETGNWLSDFFFMPGFPAAVLAAAAIAMIVATPRRSDILPVGMLATLVGLYGIFGGAWRIATKLIHGEATMAFTPSRFMTDAAYPVALLGGLLLSAALGKGRGSFPGKPRGALRVAAWVVVLAPLVIGEQWMWLKFRQVDAPPRAAVLDALGVMAGHVPRDAVMAMEFAESEYGPYILGVECMTTARPVSELMTARVRAKTVFQARLFAGRLEPSQRRELFGDRRIYVIRDRELPPGVSPIQTLGPLHVGELEP